MSSYCDIELPVWASIDEVPPSLKEAAEELPIIVIDCREERERVWVCCVYQGTAHVGALFAADLAALLAARDELRAYSLEVQWSACSGDTVLRLSCAREETIALASALSELAPLLRIP